MVKGMLEVFLVDAKGLHDTDVLGKMDPYVIIQYRSHEHKSSVKSGEGSHPVWNEKFIFPVEFAKLDEHCKLVLRILDRDRFSSDDFVGEAEVSLRELIRQAQERGSAEMQPTAHNVLLADRSYAGEIKVGLTFTLTAGSHERDYEPEGGYGGWKASAFNY